MRLFEKGGLNFCRFRDLNSERGFENDRIAQEESRSISENVTWGHRKRFADGKILMSYRNFLGYERGEDGMPVINPKEAEVVRSIYRMFMEGKTPFAIAKALEKKKVWHSTDAYRKEIYRCNHKFGREHICNTPHLTAQQIQTMFLRAYNELMRDRTQVIADCAMLREQVLDCSKQEQSLLEVEREMAVTTALVAASVKENATTMQEQDEYNRQFAALEEQYNTQKAKRDALLLEIKDKKARAESISAFMRTLATNELVLDEWDESLWLTLIDW